MTIPVAKQFMAELDRLNLEILEAINLMDEAGLISNCVITLADIPDGDALKAIAFLRQK